MNPNGRGRITEEHLEGILLNKLEYWYNEALNKLVAWGYDDEVALNAILRNGYCYGGMDVYTNILHNSLNYLLSDNEEDYGVDVNEPYFADLRQLQEYSVSEIVCLLQVARPDLSRATAIWCLLMCDLHVGRAAVMNFPFVDSPSRSSKNPEAFFWNVGPLGVAPLLYRFDCSWGDRGISKSAKRCSLCPSTDNRLKRRVTSDAVFRATTIDSKWQLLYDYAMDREAVNSLTTKFLALNLDKKPERLDQRDKVILTLIRRIKDLQKQVTEHRKWAYEKAMQAARKLSNDLNELKTLRMERDEQRWLMGDEILENGTLMLLTEMENSLKLGSGQMDIATAASRKLEKENAVLRAEIEASKLSASESIKACLEAAKREKKWLKKLSPWEKRTTKLQEDIAAQKQKISELLQELAEVDAATKETEGKWRKEQKANELAAVTLEEERRLKEASETDNRRKLDDLQEKTEMDLQRYIDDLQRLEQEHAILTAQLAALENQSHDRNPQGEAIDDLRQQHDQFKDSQDKVSCESRCIICKRNDASVLFLPCTHQILCVRCNQNYEKRVTATCPCCKALIHQRIRVYGPSS